MTVPIRMVLFLLGAVAVAALYLRATSDLPGPPELRDRYLNAINTGVEPQRHATDAVTAVNFDYRGFDTLGEEFILFVSVIGGIVLLREATEKTGEIPDSIAPGRRAGNTNTVRIWVAAMISPKVLFGLYIVTHGQLSPGGGFQGGVILATVPLIIYLGVDFKQFKKVIPRSLVEITEAVGAAGYVLVGMLAWIFGKPFLTNVLPLGRIGDPASAGTMPVISFLTGLEVAGGFILLLYSFLQETLTPQEGKA